MPDPVVDAIKARIDIAELVGAKVNLRRAGKLLKGLCPFHQERTPSFVVYPDEGRYHCFGCAKSGDAFTWLRDTQGLEFGEALKELSRRTGVPLPERQAREDARPDPEGEASRQALVEAARYFQRQLIDSPDAGAARDYLRRRGVTRASLDAFAIGWAPEARTGLVDHLARKGFTFAQLELAGLAMATEQGRRDRFRARVTFPIRDRAGTVVGFGARTLGDAQPKYLNSPQTPYFDKGATLYGLDLARGPIRQERQAVVVEGYMDVVVPHQVGFRNVVAALGTSLTDRQVEALKRYTGTIILALDSDLAGQAATLRGLEVARVALASAARPAPGSVARGGFLTTQAGELRIAVLSGGKDPDEIVREDPDRWRSIISTAVPMVDHKIAIETAGVSLDDPGAKVRVVRELARFLALVPDPVEWSHYVDRIAQRLRLDVRAVHAEVVQAEAALRRERRQASVPSVPSPRPETTSSGRVSGESAGGDEPVSARGTGVSMQGILSDPGRGAHVPVPIRADASTPRGAPAADDPLELFLISEVAANPELVAVVRPAMDADDVRDAGFRALLEAYLGAEVPADVRVEGHLAQLHARLTELASSRPHAGGELAEDPASRRSGAVLAAALRLRERSLRERLRDVQYLLREEPTADERASLQRQVERIATALGRVQLEQSRASIHFVR